MQYLQGARPGFPAAAGEENIWWAAAAEAEKRSNQDEMRHGKSRGTAWLLEIQELLEVVGGAGDGSRER